MWLLWQDGHFLSYLQTLCFMVHLSIFHNSHRLYVPSINNNLSTRFYLNKDLLRPRLLRNLWMPMTFLSDVQIMECQKWSQRSMLPFKNHQIVHQSTVIEKERRTRSLQQALQQNLLKNGEQKIVKIKWINNPKSINLQINGQKIYTQLNTVLYVSLNSNKTLWNIAMSVIFHDISRWMLKIAGLLW